MPEGNTGNATGGGLTTELPGELKKWADAIKATTEAVDALADTLDEHATRSVIIEVNNTTGSTLVLYGSGDHDWGGFRQLPPDPILPRTTGLFTSQSNGLLTGTQGNVQYRLDGEGTIFHLEWNNPFVGDNEALCRAEGTHADDYITTSVTGGGNTNVHMRFMVGEKAEAAPKQPDWRICKDCKVLFFARRDGHCAAHPLGIVSAPSADQIEASQAAPILGLESAPSHDDLQYMIAGSNPPPPPPQPSVDPAAASVQLFGKHEAAGDLFQLSYGIPGPNRQGGWRICLHCLGLFHLGEETNGVCPGRRYGHTPDDDGFDYQLVYGRAPRPSQQDNWRFCDKCFGLFFLPQNADSICPAGGNHQVNSESYLLDRL